MSNFSFVSDDALRANLDKAFDYIIELVSLIESGKYKSETTSSFRQTAIIYTAAIIEALLLDLLKKKFAETELATEKWELKNKNTLHKVSPEHEIVAGDHKLVKVEARFDRMNLGQINSLLKEKNVIKDELYRKIDKVRNLRNDQHFGTRAAIKKYSKKDLEFVFSVAGEVKKLCS